ncbi:hypothetical protein [Nocardiopsis ganjiahuensis]|uniref:hypothetical protein n=1 Tax=Nocardiopsis ganjiahuensis TaxID=239984 RepID=UPI00036EE790|nr:hypothetical protein [Nocardiopsis ganjiahuensis]
MQRARKTFATGQRVVAQGAVLPDTDPLVVKHPSLFEAVEAPEKPKRPARRKKAADADGDT